MGPIRKASASAAGLLVTNSKTLPSFFRFIEVWKPNPELTICQLCRAIMDSELEKANVALSNKKFSDAEDSYTIMINIFEKTGYLLGDDPLIKKTMANVYIKRGELQYDKDAALIDFEKAKNLDPGNRSAEASREAILIGKGKLEGTRFEGYTIRFPEGDTIGPRDTR